MNTNNGLNIWRDTWSPVSDFRREFDRLFDDLTAPTSRGLKTSQTFVPVCDVEEANDHYLLTLEMAGIREEDLKIEFNDGQLVISGERRVAAKPNGDGLWYSERRFGKFQRSFALPSGIDAEKLEASYQDGILNIVVPKAESSKPRQIKITHGAGGSTFFGKFLGQAKETQKEPKAEMSKTGDYTKSVAS
jgi:HSP20 family protein